MSGVNKILHVNSCCGCITDLTTASAIIAVLAIVTNPVLSWLMTRHTYSMRVSCYVSTMSRMDVVDLNINNIISFGFGVNSAVGNSCLTAENEGRKYSKDTAGRSKGDIIIAKAADTTATTDVVRVLGWVVLVADICWLIISVVFLASLFQNPLNRIVLAFMINGGIVIFISTIYGILYVAVCEIRGKGLALCELVLSLFDMSLWVYFLIVVNGYRRFRFPVTSAPRSAIMSGR